MYFIEQLVKLFHSKKSNKIKYTALEIDSCNHLFLPIDSSGEFLACTKCGKLVNKNDINKSN